MIGVAKVFAKELEELLNRPHLALWLVIVPLCFLYIAGSTNATPPSLRTLVQHAPEAEPASQEVRDLVAENPQIELLEWQESWSPSPVGLVQARARIGVFWQDGWRVVVRPRNAEERMALLALANRIVLSIGFKAPFETVLMGSRAKSPQVEVQVLDFGAAPDQSDAYLVPRMTALIAVFLPFLMAISTIARERENGSLGTLLVAPGVGWWNLVIGKTITCLFVAVACLFLLIIAAGTIFDMSVQSTLLGGLGIQFLAILVSTLLGLAASALVRAQFQAYLLSSVYAFCLIFLTGLLFPLEQATETVRFASWFLPLTFSREPLEQAMLLGAPAWPFGREAWWLVGQCVVSAALAVASLTIARNRL